MLLIDAGNSRVKWMLVCGQESVRGAVNNAEWSRLDGLWRELPAPSRIVASNVAGAEMAERLRTVCRQWPVEPKFVEAQAEQCGVRNGYALPAQLGSDRWAALIGAWHAVRCACLVVNCGTATTVDALTGEGVFLGGLILPGMALMQRSLSEAAAQLSADEGMVQTFPRNTADALYNGALQATLGAIGRQYTLLQAQTPSARCIISGGAAMHVADQLELPHMHIEDLVLQGLKRIAEETEA
ncbi:MAG: type III pantothenate kinase [Pseudomonadota bacterium]